MSARRSALLIAVIAAGAFLARLPQLDARPLHGDEAVHAWKLDELLEQGRFDYDPTEYHGPTLHYATAPVAYLCGATRFADQSKVLLRVVPVVFGTLTILTLILLIDAVGSAAAVWGALLLAASPSVAFFSRYYIPEALLGCFTLATIACFWRASRSMHLGWSVAAGIFAGLMHATKETCVLAFGAMLLAGVITLRVRPRNTGRLSSAARFFAFSIAAGVTSLAVFSDGFRDWDDVRESVTTFRHYVDRAGDPLHQHPAHYYMSLLVGWRAANGPLWTELPAMVFATVGVVLCWRGRRSFERIRQTDAHPSSAAPSAVEPNDNVTAATAFCRFLAIYVALLTVGYALIPYKTPWSLLSFWQGWLLLAGIGIAWLHDRIPPGTPRLTVLTLALITVGVLLSQQYRSTATWFTQRARYAFDTCPYVYAHPGPAVEDLARYVTEVSDASAPAPVVHVFSPNAWPIPWYLRRLQVGYWEKPPVAKNAGETWTASAPIVIVTSDCVPLPGSEFAPGYVVSHYGLRRDVHCQVYVERGYWERFARRQSFADGTDPK